LAQSTLGMAGIREVWRHEDDDHRTGFYGPPNSGNGGYVCGMLVHHITGAAEVTLRSPPPIGTGP